MLKRSSRIFVFILGLMAFGSQGTEAQVLYAADGADGHLSNLYILNAATGAVSSTVGPIGFAVTGLAFHPTTGVLYGVTAVENSPPQPQPSLISINPSTGAGTLIGPVGPVGCLVPPANSTKPVTDITFRADGTLFGWSRCTDDLVTINEYVRGQSGVSIISNPLNCPDKYSRMTSRFASVWALFSWLMRSRLSLLQSLRNVVIPQAFKPIPQHLSDRATLMALPYAA